MPSSFESWDLLIDHLKEQECILFIGPDAFRYDETRSVSDRVWEDIMANQGRYNLKKRYQDEGFVVFKENDASFSHRITRQLKTDFPRYTKEAPLKDFLQALTKIPFRAIISLASDLSLEEAFETPIQSVIFKKQAPAQASIPPYAASNSPLLFYLLGALKDQESLIYSLSDTFDFIRAFFAFGETEQGRILRDDYLKPGIHYLFLGLPFERWYMQLLMKAFQIPKGKGDHHSLTPFQGRHQAYYQDHFNMTFVEVEIPDFIHQLYHHCEEAGISRKKPLPQEILQTFLNQNQMAQAFEWAKDKLTDKTQVPLLQGRWAYNEKQFNQNTVSQEDAKVERNRIKQALLALFNP